jgi:Protein of unknown function (DUF3631)
LADDLANPIAEIEQYLSKYMVFPTEGLRFTVALWIIGTYLHKDVDVFPYLSITAATKRAGKTRLLELLKILCANSQWMTGGTGPSILYMIRDEAPTLLFDEAERLSSESTGIMREAMNSGYKKGQTIPRVGGSDGDGNKRTEHWPSYCPKAFSLIGDVNDTLRDRSIIVQLKRGTPEQMDKLTRFVSRHAEPEGRAIAGALKQYVEDRKEQLMTAYDQFDGLPFLTSDRDEELWTSLFVICQAFTPSRVTELQRIAVDVATEKTADARSYSELNQDGAEQRAQDEEYGLVLLRHLNEVMNGDKVISTADALQRLYDMPTAPWRKFRGTGLTPVMMADLLAQFNGLTPKPVRMGKKDKGRGQPVKRGYTREDVQRALKAI